ncbi:MAG: CBS domain-containing protein [Spirochaetes bacterium]|uniref:CBS domain-containing protein n=1 Tax=Candidatus Avitreponema avistercoris TaxID=2840705 RepID=A0A9D9HGU5_9SPIR|nr:CBS domain-containing protein [Candidatus Avitreponema avistercoris]
MTIARVMRRNPVAARPEMTVTEAKERMEREHVGKLPVVDKNGRLVGVFTKKDLLRAGPSPATSLDVYEIGYLLSKLTVEKTMTRDAVTVQETEVVEEAARVMAEKDIGCLPVMRGDVLVGLVTKDDLFRVFVRMFAGGEQGVRVTFLVEEKPGMLVRLTAGVAELGGNILSLTTFDGDSPANRRCTMKVSGVDSMQLRRILETAGAVIEDIR